MAHLYTRKSSAAEQKNMKPRKETIDFLLNYSRALKVVDYEEIHFDTILN
ncbi:hypothetical protein [Sinomicrobium soli]|nr:hypothetical protein [Sinomicrobium sp. N-1-3-6]